ncbi:unnamed protein product [Didymodactylos carnosus]|uniref:Uncharacterized protein n=1 Tax=Didymodactylos carnosus TaxID=1234261 RepID=A0A8S2KPK5_9BILA|nr:unnamed protein product [Didymodactylos carnosus]CAF3863069.1 unnamed protein product [Didymodactylos carnosus]
MWQSWNRLRNCKPVRSSRSEEKKDSPFLNCFEKHMVDIHQLIQPIHWTITRELLAWLSGFLELSTVTTAKHFILIQHMIVNFNCHYVCNLVIDHYKQDEQESTIKYCKDKFICASSFDFVLMLTLNHQENSSLIQQYYDRKKISFNDIIIDILENKNKNKYGQIIYTYTQIYETIHYPNILDNNIDEVKLANFISELELINKVKQYYQPSMQKSLLIIRIDYHKEKNHLLLLKRDLIKEKIYYLIQSIQDETYFNDWRKNLITDATIANTCYSFYSALQSILFKFYDKYLLILFYYLEKQSFIDSYFYLKDNSELLEILRIFKLGFLLFDQLPTNLIKTSLVIVNDRSTLDTLESKSTTYTLILYENAFYHIPPEIPVHLDKVSLFEPIKDSDPVIENCFVNLVEILTDINSILNVTNIQFLSNIYSLIVQKILHLIQLQFIFN